MKSGLFDIDNVEICDGDIVTVNIKDCSCGHKIRVEKLKVKFEYGAFYLLRKDNESIYDKEMSTLEELTLGQLAMHYGDHGDGYSYYLPNTKLNNVRIVKE